MGKIIPARIHSSCSRTFQILREEGFAREFKCLDRGTAQPATPEKRLYSSFFLSKKDLSAVHAPSLTTLTVAELTRAQSLYSDGKLQQFTKPHFTEVLLHPGGKLHKTA
jgi:hypothetical protein